MAAGAATTTSSSIARGAGTGLAAVTTGARCVRLAASVASADLAVPVVRAASVAPGGREVRAALAALAVRTDPAALVALAVQADLMALAVAAAGRLKVQATPGRPSWTALPDREVHSPTLVLADKPSSTVSGARPARPA